MKTQQNRLSKLEQKKPKVEVQFIYWKDHPWTPEQEAEAIRLHPEQKVFWPSLLETFPLPPRKPPTET